MRVGKWRWVLVPIAVLVAGCLPSPKSDLPASFENRLQESGWGFDVAPLPTADVITAPDVVAKLAGVAADVSPMLRTRAVPVFGLIRCAGAVKPCQPGASSGLGTLPWPVWIVVFPDHASADGEVGWVLVNARDRFLSEFQVHDPFDP
jgi:hypothetical protein